MKIFAFFESHCAEAYQQYLKRYGRIMENTNENISVVDLKIRKSIDPYDSFIRKTINALELKKPIQNIYKRPI